MVKHVVLLVRSRECGWDEAKAVVTAQPEIQTVFEATDAQQAINIAQVNHPDVILSPAKLDNHPTHSMLAELRRHAAPDVKVIVLASRFSQEEILDFVDVGIVGHLLWADLSVEALEHLFALVLSNNFVVASQEIASAVVEQHELRRDRGFPPDDKIHVSERDRAVLRRLAEGRTRDEIAFAEAMSRRTVDRVIAQLEVKLDAPTPFVLGQRSVALGLIEPSLVDNA